MKKIATLLVAGMCGLAAMATNYNGQLSVLINGIGGTQDNVSISIEKNDDGTYNLHLDNFCLVTEDTNIAVGNIRLDSVAANEGEKYTNLSVQRIVNIEEGDLPDVDFWLGPILGDVPIVMNATFTGQVLSVHIDIDMMEESIEQIIKVDYLAAPDKGDVNNDGTVDVSDMNEVINIMLQ